MSGLKINGRPAVATGSVMIPSGTSGALPLPGGDVTFVFKTDGAEGYKWDHWTLTITAQENPLGIALDVPLQAPGGAPLILSMTIHTVGTGAKAYRIINYTAYLP